MIAVGAAQVDPTVGVDGALAGVAVEDHGLTETHVSIKAGVRHWPCSLALRDNTHLQPIGG